MAGTRSAGQANSASQNTSTRSAVSKKAAPKKAVSKKAILKKDVPKMSVAGLERQVADLQDFILSQDLLLKAPVSIRRHIESRPDAAAYTSRTIRASIATALSKLGPCGPHGITSDDYSVAVAKFIPEVERLAKMPEGLEQAFDMLQYLGRRFYGDLDIKHGCGFGNREGDEETDALMCRLIRKMKAKNEGWCPTDVLNSLDKQHKMLSDYGIDGVFPRSIKLLSSIVAGSD